MTDSLQGHPRASGREAWTLAGLFLATLLPRLVLFVLARPWDPAIARGTILVNDAGQYHQRALEALGPRGFYPPDIAIDYIRPPLFPLFAAAIYRVAGVLPWLVLLAHALLAGFTCLLLYGALRGAGHRRAALFAAVAFALDPTLVLQSNLFLSETLSLFFLAVAMAFLRPPLETRLAPRSGAALAAAGLGIGLATLTRPAAQFMPLALVPAFFVAAPRPAWRPIVASLLVALVFAGSVTPWVLRNRAAFHVAAISTIQDWSPLFMVVVGPVESARTGESAGQVEDRLARETAALARRDGVDPDTLNRFQLARYWRRLTFDYVRRDPRSYAVLGLRRTVLFFGNLQTSGYAGLLRLRGGPTDIETGRATTLGRIGGDWMARKHPAEKLVGGVVLLWHLLSYTCLAVGLRVAWTRRGGPFLLACGLVALGFVVAGAPVGEARFRTSALLFYLPFVGLGAEHLWSHRPGARKPAIT